MLGPGPVSDPEGVEAAGLTELRGMGLLEMETVFHGEKVQRQTAGMFSGVEGMLAGLNELRYEGYEIHMGRSEAQMPALAGNGNVYGSYVHGIFDAPGIADEILKAICARRGVAFSRSGPSTGRHIGSGSMICWRTRCARDWIWNSFIGC